MNNNYRQLKQILDNAPEGSVFWDGEDYLDLNFYSPYTNVSYFADSNSSTGVSISRVNSWQRKDPINTGQLRRLSDIQEIVDLMEKVALAQVGFESIANDLKGVGDE